MSEGAAAERWRQKMAQCRSDALAPYVYIGKRPAEHGYEAPRDAVAFANQLHRLAKSAGTAGRLRKQRRTPTIGGWTSWLGQRLNKYREGSRLWLWWRTTIKQCIQPPSKQAKWPDFQAEPTSEFAASFKTPTPVIMAAAPRARPAPRAAAPADHAVSRYPADAAFSQRTPSLN